MMDMKWAPECQTEPRGNNQKKHAVTRRQEKINCGRRSRPEPWGTKTVTMTGFKKKTQPGDPVTMPIRKPREEEGRKATSMTMPVKEGPYENVPEGGGA